MPSLPLNKLVTGGIVLIAVVVLAVLVPQGKIWASKGVNLVETLNPAGFVINEFKVAPFLASTGKTGLIFTVTGNVQDADLKIYMTRTLFGGAAPLSMPEPEYSSDTSKGWYLIYSNENAKNEKAETTKEGLLSADQIMVSCPDNNGCRNGVNFQIGAGNQDITPGLYSFSATLTSTDGKVIGRPTSMVLYSDDSIEQLNRPLTGCDKNDIGCQSVIECKKYAESNAVEGLSIELKLDKSNAYTTPAYATLQQILNNKDGITAGSCVKYVLTGPKSPDKLDFSGCDVKGVDDFSIKFVRFFMFSRAADPSTDKYLTNGKFVQTLSSESEYANLDQVSINNLRVDALKLALFCSKGNGQSGPLDNSWNPQMPYAGSVYGILSKTSSTISGMVPLPNQQSRIEKLNAELDKVLPSTLITNLVPVFRKSDNTFSLSWKVSTRADTVKASSYRISHYYTKWPRAVSNDNPKTLVSQVTISGQASDGNLRTTYQTGESIPAKDKAVYRADLEMAPGVHKFEVEVIGSSNSVISKATESSPTGIFDDNYIETFADNVDLTRYSILGGIAEKGDLVFGKCDLKSTDQNSLPMCNVIGKKMDDMKGGYAKPEIFTKAGVSSNCQYKMKSASGHALELLDSCTPEEVDKLWKEYLKYQWKDDAKGTSLYNCNPVALTTGGTPNLDGASGVCIVKRQLVDTLNNLGWADLRTNKGWEAKV